MTLFGYGITTKAIAQKFGGCKIYDDKFSALTIDKLGNEFHPSENFNPQVADLEITSPGIPPSHPLIQKAKHLVSEYDLFAPDMPFSIWVSGTNGKTTTTAMIEALLRDKGAIAGGNIGTPLAKLDKDAPIWILETSSFTLHYTNIASANLYILLPITPDHISWHGSFEAYEAAKLKPLKTMREGEIAILPKKYADVETMAMKILYEDAKDLARYFDFDLEKIDFKEPFLTDALLAMATKKILFDVTDYESINAFEIGAHRVEEFTDKKNRLWVNDSKATNADATIAALASYHDKKIYLILGGDDKGADLSALFNALKPLDVEIFAIGSNSDKILESSHAIGKVAHRCEVLQDAVIMIDSYHDNRSVALLSPAAASLDQFSSYAKRGEDFIAFVKDLR
jgi:UDP-N-acetylmuramoylalanine--D-glutamate ligase